MPNKKSGFTIIEVVLVLAIAGLIFLMVFVALPSLQRSQRDTQRKNDLSTLSSAMVSYSSNNNKLPSTDAATVDTTTDTSASNPVSGTSTGWGAFVYNYLLGGGNDEFAGPSDGYYSLDIQKQPTAVGTELANSALFTTGDAPDKVVIVLGASCNGDAGIKREDRDGNRNFAIAMKLEAGGYYCLDN